MINYFKAIKVAVLIFLVIQIFLLFPLLKYLKYKYKHISIYKVIIIYSFILYLLILYFLIIYPLPNIDNIKYNKMMVRLIPLSFIKDFIRDNPLILNNPNTYIKALMDPSFYIVLFNILMMIPLGIYLRYYFNCNFKKTTMITFLISLFFELTQLSGLYFIYPYPYRVFDVDDLILNTLGGVIGYFI